MPGYAERITVFEGLTALYACARDGPTENIFIVPWEKIST